MKSKEGKSEVEVKLLLPALREEGKSSTMNRLEEEEETEEAIMEKEGRGVGLELSYEEEAK